MKEGLDLSNPPFPPKGLYRGEIRIMEKIKETSIMGYIGITM